MPVKVRLLHKYADQIDGVDLSGVRAGQIIQVPTRDAKLLIAEGWATRMPRERSVAHDRPPRKTKG